MSEADRFRKRNVASELERPVREARALAQALGLDPSPVNYWIVDHDEMNALIAYEGFQSRYPHWRWGMAYDRQRKRDQYHHAKAFEIVNNDIPANAFLQESNARADQKAVITHVEAHADFFANNEWFGLFPGDRSTQDAPTAAAMLERHGEAIEEYMSDPDIDRSAVESWIDNVLTIQDCIDQHAVFTRGYIESRQTDADPGEETDRSIDGLDISEEIRQAVFDDDWLESSDAMEDTESIPAEPEPDILGFLMAHGKRYDSETERAHEMEPWQREVIDMLRTEAYYFAPQRMTKVMNEGWAAYWESTMMSDEGFANGDEFIAYADHMSSILASPGLNPYRLGLQLWEYIENEANRREVLDRLLRVDGVTWRNFFEAVDIDAVLDHLEPPEALDRLATMDVDVLESLDADWVDSTAVERVRSGEIDIGETPWNVLTYAGLARRHYSLTKPQHRGFLRRVGRTELERIGRYLDDTSRYDSVSDALDAVEYTAGWDRLFDVRESHNDVTFIDAFLTPEFVTENEYFTYEYAHTTDRFHVASDDPESVKKKLLLRFTNFGKPTIVVLDGNYDNAGELLLGHQYNGVMLDIEAAMDTLERVFQLWGRPVNLLTIVKDVDEHDIEVAKRRKQEPEVTEEGRRLRYDGEEASIEAVEWSVVEALAADDVDYDTKPEEWLA